MAMKQIVVTTFLMVVLLNSAPTLLNQLGVSDQLGLDQGLGQEGGEFAEIEDRANESAAGGGTVDATTLGWYGRVVGAFSDLIDFIYPASSWLKNTIIPAAWVDYFFGLTTFVLTFGTYGLIRGVDL